MFTKQHYQALARMIAGRSCVQLLSKKPSDYIYKPQFVDALADFLAGDNPLFNRDLFITACYKFDGNHKSR